MNKAKTRTAIGVGVLAAWGATLSWAGNLTANKVLTDELQVLQIGLRPPTGPEALYYSFTNDMGGTVTDDSGNGLDGTVYTAVWTNAGRPGGSMYFNLDGDDDNDDLIDVGTALDFPAWDRYSVSIWFLHDGGGDYGPGYGHNMVAKNNYYHDWKTGLNLADGSVFVVLNEDSAGLGIGDTSHDFRDSAWHHCVVTRDGNLGEFWVDGALKSTSTDFFTVHNSSPLYVGNSPSEDGYQRKSWSGMLDELHIFTYALSSNEVNRLYTVGSLIHSNTGPNTILVGTNLTVQGAFAVTGQVSFTEGVYYARPLGDLSCGIYTNSP